MLQTHPDIEVICSVLPKIESEASRLRWAKNRPWTLKTHVWFENSLPMVDLHDLNAKLAKKSLQSILQAHSKIETGAICFITGVGKNSNIKPAMRNMVLNLLHKAAQKNDWDVQLQGMGRVIIVFDPEKAPAAATGKLPKVFWFAVVGFILLLLGSMFHSCWPK